MFSYSHHSYAPHRNSIFSFPLGLPIKKESGRPKHKDERLTIDLVEGSFADIGLKKPAHGKWTLMERKTIRNLNDSGLYGIRSHDMDWVNLQYAKFEKLLGLQIPRDCSIINHPKQYHVKEPNDIETKWLFISLKNEKVFGKTYRDGHYDADREDIPAGSEEQGISMDFYPSKNSCYIHIKVGDVLKKSEENELSIQISGSNISADFKHLQYDPKTKGDTGYYDYYGGPIWLDTQYTKFEKLLGFSIPKDCSLVIKH